jgi:hypothetical protein
MSRPIDGLTGRVRLLAVAKFGIETERYDLPGLTTDEKGIVRDGPTISWFKDPAGNVLPVIEADVS